MFRRLWRGGKGRRVGWGKRLSGVGWVGVVGRVDNVEGEWVVKVVVEGKKCVVKE